MKTSRTLACAMLLIGAAWIALPLTASSLTSSSGEPVHFKVVTFVPTNNILTKGTQVFIDRVNEKFGEYVHFELLGGPEITPPFQLHDAVRHGVVDAALTSCGYFPSLLWEAQTAMYTNKEWDEVQQTNYDETMRGLYAKVGLTYLGNASQEMKFTLFTNFQVNSLEDFKNKKIRVFPPFIPFVKALGATPINMPMGDIYTAMERGTVDGFVMSHIGFVKDYSWNEVTKYAIKQQLYQATAVLLVNSEKWQQLPADVQEAIIKFKEETVDPEVAAMYDKVSKDDWQLMLDNGVKEIALPEAERKAFETTAYQVAWNRILEKSPEKGPQLEKMLIK